MSDLNDIRDQIEENISTLSEMVNNLRSQLRELARAGMPDTAMYEAYVIAHLASLTYSDTKYNTTLSDLLNAVDKFIEEGGESEEDND